MNKRDIQTVIGKRIRITVLGGFWAFDSQRDVVPLLQFTWNSDRGLCGDHGHIAKNQEENDQESAAGQGVDPFHR